MPRLYPRPMKSASLVMRSSMSFGFHQVQPRRLRCLRNNGHYQFTRKAMHGCVRCLTVSWLSHALWLDMESKRWAYILASCLARWHPSIYWVLEVSNGMFVGSLAPLTVIGSKVLTRLETNLTVNLAPLMRLDKIRDGPSWAYDL